MNKHFGLLGETLSYSLSPKIHQMIYDKLGIKATYELVEIPIETFSSELKHGKLNQFDGFNVTIPYKESILSLLDDIDPAAARIGAVNTVVNNNGAFKGYNTDYYGFMSCVDDLDIKRRHRAVVLGTGGAAKMAVVALEELGFEDIVIVSRNPLNAQSKFSNLTCINYATFNSMRIVSDLLVNCTPMGQKVLDATEVIENVVLSNQGTLFDLNYNPPVTPLLAQGRAIGVHGINGLKMLIAQAVKAEEIWLQMPMQVEKITKEIIEAIVSES